MGQNMRPARSKCSFLILFVLSTPSVFHSIITVGHRRATFSRQEKRTKLRNGTWPVVRQVPMLPPARGGTVCMLDGNTHFWWYGGERGGYDLRSLDQVVVFMLEPAWMLLCNRYRLCYFLHCRWRMAVRCYLLIDLFEFKFDHININFIVWIKKLIVFTVIALKDLKFFLKI
jgi:hypothetical protein